jgi:hypothetical protein
MGLGMDGSSAANSSPPSRDRLSPTRSWFFNAHGYMLEVKVTDAMTEAVVHLLKEIQIDIDEGKDSVICRRFTEQLIEVSFHVEAVWKLSEHIELGTVYELSMEVPIFNGKGGEMYGHVERCFRLIVKGSIVGNVHMERAHWSSGARKDGASDLN